MTTGTTGQRQDWQITQIRIKEREGVELRCTNLEFVIFILDVFRCLKTEVSLMILVESHRLDQCMTTGWCRRQTSKTGIKLLLRSIYVNMPSSESSIVKDSDFLETWLWPAHVHEYIRRQCGGAMTAANLYDQRSSVWVCLPTQGEICRSRSRRVRVSKGIGKTSALSPHGPKKLDM